MSILWQARFFTTVNHLRNLPDLQVPELAFAGRSNAGKSTAINTLCNQKKLAFASKTPGRTQHINYFSIGGAHVAQHRKDPTKVDRSAAYAARYVAKNIVAAGLASKVEIQLAYAIGVATPVSISVETYGTSKHTEAELVQLIRKNFDLTPAGMIDMLQLRQPIYQQTAAYGHFGRTDLNLPWENTDKAEKLRAQASH